MLNLRIEISRDDDSAALRDRAYRALREHLDAQGLSSVSIQHDARPVAVNPRSGKLQRVTVQS
jgi:hypothetical protein